MIDINIYIVIGNFINTHLFLILRKAYGLLASFFTKRLCHKVKATQ